ncbi:MAG: glycosyltransferase family 2 protein [Christensenellaceae bacterium]
MVSVIIPSYNRAATLLRAMQSVLSQSYTDLELIVVDDGSKDETKEVVSSVADPRVRYVYQENGGACKARNRGIEEARGELIAFQDSDDEWLEGKLARQVRYMEETGADMVYCALDSYYEDGEKEGVLPPSFPPCRQSKEETVRQMLTSGTVVTQTILVRAERAKEIRFDEEMPRYQEWEWSVRFARSYSVAFLPEVLVRRYIQKDSISRVSKNLPVAISRIFYKNKDVIRSDRGLWKLWTREVANHRFAFGLPCAKECLYAFGASGNVKFLVKGLLSLIGLQKKVAKYAD